MSATKPSLDELRIDREPEKSRSSAMIWPLLIVIFVIAAAAGFVRVRNQKAVIEVQVAVAQQSGESHADRTVLHASGYVTARRKATVSAKTTGKVTEVLIEEGLKVKEGQVLARLDESNIKTALDVAKAQLESARMAVEETRAQLKQADAEFERAKELTKLKISSQSDFDKAESDAAALRARLARQDLDIKTADRTVVQVQQELDDMTIRAPFDGVVTTKDAQPGEMISPVSAGGGFTRTGICTVVDMNSLEIELDVNESYINRVEAGQPAEATLDAYPEWNIPCKVIAIIPTADRQKSTVKVRVGFNALNPRILPDMGVKVAFLETAEAATNSAAPVVLVPKSALQNQAGHDVVFIVNNGRAEQRAIFVRDLSGAEAALSSGVNPGEHVIIDCPPGLKDGATVKEKKP